MNDHNAISWKWIRLVIASLVFSSATQNAGAGSLLYSIDEFLTGHFPVATAHPSLYEPDGVFIDGKAWTRQNCFLPNTSTPQLKDGYV